MTHPLECAHLRKTYGDTTVLDGVSLSVRRGEIMALLGPSGSGKTTVLRLVAGFDFPDAGTIRIAGREVASESARVPPEQRRVGMVFQEYALFPHLSVRDNIAFGLPGKGREREERVDELLALAGLAHAAGRMPYELSGGQQQRVALARALAPAPDLLLLDEPFSNLDAALRAQVRDEVRQILKRAGMTCVFVTHDQEEALSLADEVAVLLDGRIAQVAPPYRLYHEPASPAVAAFVGEANLLPGDAEGAEATCVLGCVALRQPARGPVTLLLRPENLILTPDPQGDGAVTWRQFYGHDQRVGVTLAGTTELVARLDAAQPVDVGERVRVGVARAVPAFPRSQAFH